MKKLFFAGLLGLLLFEVTNVYFIMPMPGSQEMNSINIAYFLYRWRWFFRVLFGVMIITGLLRGQWKYRGIPYVSLLPLMTVIYMFNFVMSADHMFYQPSAKIMKTATENITDTARIVLGVIVNDEERAYPVRYIGYHHQVVDTVGGKPLIITYCTVCRSGRVYEPLVNGRPEKFRLVGMDHFNALFEDETTGSWWRQATGEAITGKRKGTVLPEVLSSQASLRTWLRLHPASLVMQEDPAFKEFYDTTINYESGKSRKLLTGTDSLSWNKKSWVIGIKHAGKTKAYDWNELLVKREIQDRIGNDSVMVILSTDNKSFFAFRKPMGAPVNFVNDTIFFQGRKFRLNGTGVDTAGSLEQIKAYQEFWHSWQEFNPGTERF